MPAERLLGWLGAAVFLLTLFARAAHRNGPKPFRRELMAWIGDPVFLAWSLLMALLVIQWMNGGREPRYDRALGAWTYGPPPVAWLPSSVSRWEAAAMLHWFVPAGAVVFAIRKAMRRASRGMLIRLLSVNAGALALFGIFQLVFDVRIGYGLRQAGSAGHYFATFAYSNHAGAYFTLLFGLAAGAFLHDALRPGIRPRAWMVATGSSALLCLAGASLSLSQAALALVWTLAVLAVGIFIVHGWTSWGPVKRLNVLLNVGAVACLVLLFVSGMGRTRAIEEYDGLGKSLVHRDVEGRQFLTDAAADLWRSAPWFGTGGWGFRHFLPVMLGEEQWNRMSSGHANVHCDGLQYLAEFGVVGTGLLLVSAALLFVPVFCGPAWRQPGTALMIAALLAIVAHSFIDLPFRCPAILCTWWGTLTIVSRNAQARAAL